MGNLSCYAVVVPGLETMAGDELNELAAHNVQVEEGGVSFTTTMDGLFRINLRSRIVTRVLIRLASFRAMSFPELYNKSRKVAWEHYIGSQVSVSVRASCKTSKLMHSGRAEQAVSDAVRDRLEIASLKTVSRKDEAGAIEANNMGNEQQILLRIENNQCTISLDTSGERLDRRGYRLHSGKAPVRETIAAAMLRWMDWSVDEPLLTPMCGSGTFAIEAAWIAEKRAPGLNHRFPFIHWPVFKQKRWHRAVEKARAMQSSSSVCIIASELDAGILKQARENAALAGVGDVISFEKLDVCRLTVPENISDPGLIVCNPPYGDRVKVDVKSLYKSLGEVFSQQFSGWRMAVMVPDQICENALGLKVKKRFKIKHGGRWVHVLSV
ncbi:MAG: class I SAM-dependent RNA methyltransferase [Mariprofundus sp.]|nr:class I SAM-dependent RNA methyltransferase [Mariprofundus sp.]